MKRLGWLVAAAVLGSALTIGAFRLWDSGNPEKITIEHLSDTPVRGAVYTVNKTGDIVPLEFTKVAKKVMPAVVHIKSTQVHQFQQYREEDNPFRHFFDDDVFKHFFGPDYPFQDRQPRSRGPQVRVGSGSGVIITADGYIVTNNHVIQNADDIEVILNDNRVFKAKIVGTDRSTDLALLQIRAKDLAYISFVNSDQVEVGEWVLAVGNPFHLNSTVTAGIVSAKGRNLNLLRDQSAIESFIQTDAAINPGNSGGALVNLQGGLIGINTAIASPTGAYAGYGFAVPSNIVQKVVEDLMTYGVVQRGYLGLMIRSVDGDLARELDLEVTQGVYVDSIMENSSAGAAGLTPGDVVIRVDDVDVKSSGELLELIGRRHPGDKVQLTINRKGKKLIFPVILRNQAGDAELASKASKEVFDILGVELEEIDSKTARRLNIEGGLKVTALKAGKLKRHTDMKVGFIITKLDGKEVKTVQAFEKLLTNKKGGILLEGIYEDYLGTYYYALGL
ncbi:MAG: Do family serine endopeptidase [Marinilabiliaceae bacterium]|nr:Do family serine endopeptidase [Marinilabiliaceae bacterium]